MQSKNHELELEYSDEVYTPREDSYLLYDTLKQISNDYNSILEIGSGSGFIILSLSKLHPLSSTYAIDINYQAARLTLKNAKQNKINNIAIICGDLLSCFRNNSQMDLIFFNPPYLPADYELDKYLTESEYQQYVGGDKGFELVTRLLQSLQLVFRKLYLIISSLAITPEEFNTIHQPWQSDVVDEIITGFEKLWVLQIH